MILALTIMLGILLGRVKIAGISLGATFILFIGILFGELGMKVDGGILHFFQEFGLILFVFSIGLQVGPSFFSNFKKGCLLYTSHRHMVLISQSKARQCGTIELPL